MSDRIGQIQRLSELTHALRTCVSPAEHALLAGDLRQAEREFIDHELAAYLAGDPDTAPLTNAAVLAEMIATRGAHPLPPAHHNHPRLFAPAEHRD